MDRETWQRTLRAAGYTPRPLADPATLATAERRLGVTFPEEVQSVYKATDGIYDSGGQWFVIWPLDDLVTRNLEVWTGECTGPPDSLLAFGDDGTGSPFCVSLTGNPTVHVWNNIDRQTRPLAPSLPAFWHGWVAGSITT